MKRRQFHYHKPTTLTPYSNASDSQMQTLSQLQWTQTSIWMEMRMKDRRRKKKGVWTRNLCDCHRITHVCHPCNLLRHCLCSATTCTVYEEPTAETLDSHQTHFSIHTSKELRSTHSHMENPTQLNSKSSATWIGHPTPIENQ